MIRIFIFTVLFVVSLVGIVAGLPSSSRPQTTLRMAGLFVGAIVLGIVYGIGYGWLFGPVDGGPAVGGFAFGVVGFMTAICASVYLVTNHPNWQSDTTSPMPLAVAIAIPLCSFLAASVGWLLPIEDDSERALMPLVTALGGAMLGVVFGVVYEKGKAALLAVLGFVVLSILAAMLIAWLDNL